MARAVRWVRSQIRGVPTPLIIWTLIGASALFCLLGALRERNKHRAPQASESAATQGNVPEDKPKEETSAQQDEINEKVEDEEEDEEGQEEKETDDETEEGSQEEDEREESTEKNLRKRK